VESSFRFSVKVPRLITHDLELRRARQPLEEFVAQSGALGRKRGPLLVQLPPSLSFEARVARRFFNLMRTRVNGFVVCEPRHPTWFSAEADAVLTFFEIGRVAADPPPVAEAATPGGWPGIVYYRWHGAPRKYWSSYDDHRIHALADAIQAVTPGAPAWCIFDNTASGAAIENAWRLQDLISTAAD
jgi:uncharacterized protein YecE (DUF72 family)